MSGLKIQKKKKALALDPHHKPSNFTTLSSLETKTILVVDPCRKNRAELTAFGSENFFIEVIHKDSLAISLLKRSWEHIDIVLYYLPNKEHDTSFLRIMRSSTKLNKIPVIVLSEAYTTSQELQMLELGAYDYLATPYDPQVFSLRVHNALKNSKTRARSRLRYLAEHDSLTGLFNREEFFKRTDIMLHENPDHDYLFLRLDIRRFSLINSCFGMDEGNDLLRFLATIIDQDLKHRDLTVYGRMEADVFAICTAVSTFDNEKIITRIFEARKHLCSYNAPFRVVPKFGLYLTRGERNHAKTLYSCVTLAVKSLGSGDDDFYSFFTPTMFEKVNNEQQIINEMHIAIDEKQFEFFLQPKYGLGSEELSGAEALVRWRHPTKGMISPGAFIPVFEKNGFIMKLDFYVWESVCQLLRRWLDEGKKPIPISVNVSRINIYRHSFVEDLIQLVERYQIPPELLELELTESAYTDSPETLTLVMQQLQEFGFKVLMDDFGSGYSSLNILKDLSIDLIKIDMGFLMSTKNESRAENIISAVIRMSKWLGIPVTAEGVETQHQADMLRSIGCDYAQGYYFAKPMSVDSFELLWETSKITHDTPIPEREAALPIEDIWKSNSQLNLLFSSIINGVAIYELCGTTLELIRANDAYFSIIKRGKADYTDITLNVMKVIHPDDCSKLLDAFTQAKKANQPVECTYRRFVDDGDIIYMHSKYRHISGYSGRDLFFATHTDITAHKKLEELLHAERQKCKALKEVIENLC